MKKLTLFMSLLLLAFVGIKANAATYTVAGSSEALFGTQCRIRPHREDYLEMLRIAWQKGKDFLPDCETQQNKTIGGSFWEVFSSEEIRQMKEILEDGKYIPQEIINISDLRRNPCNTIS